MSTRTPDELPVPALSLLLDFDGTVALGDGPVYAYAEAVGQYLEPAGRDALHSTLHAFLTEPGGAGLPFIDGYDAVAQLSGSQLTDDQRQAAYRASREAVARGEVPVQAPEGLSDFLAAIGRKAHRILLTNAPLNGVTESLQSLGLTEVIDEIIPDAGKPAGLERLLPALLAGREPQALLSVGDVWINDLKYPGAAGCATAFIDRFDLRSGPTNLRAARIEDLYAGMLAWAENPASIVALQAA
ncbi:HAD family hydrolase [Psychromicrobium xiongbiense]|uniref:HAD family hydrolase n=1 Tax=Psychromicrobium xiongbiense TaxID=3051184 RepID=UPI0025571DD6|nr:hydrolase [Psychromicrobium sp. YIM S02556]